MMKSRVGILLFAFICVLVGVSWLDALSKRTGRLGSIADSLPAVKAKNLRSHDDGSHQPTTTQRESTDPPKVLLFITTVFSDQHQRYLKCCWPQLIRESHNLKHTHVMIFSNMNVESPLPDINEARRVFANNPSLYFNFASQNALDEANNYTDQLATEWKNQSKIYIQKQVGANLAMKLAFSEKWFEPYDWVIRINPDVLIRNSTWLWETMKDQSVDAILIPCSDSKTARPHTDFFALRPRAMRPGAFYNLSAGKSWGPNHELTAYYAFKHIIESKGARYVPDVAPSLGRCKAQGENSSIYHKHDSCDAKDMKCNALEGWPIT